MYSNKKQPIFRPNKSMGRPSHQSESQTRNAPFSATRSNRVLNSSSNQSIKHLHVKGYVPHHKRNKTSAYAQPPSLREDDSRSLLDGRSITVQKEKDYVEPSQLSQYTLNSSSQRSSPTRRFSSMNMNESQASNPKKGSLQSSQPSYASGVHQPSQGSTFKADERTVRSHYSQKSSCKGRVPTPARRDDTFTNLKKPSNFKLPSLANSVAPSRARSLPREATRSSSEDNNKTQATDAIVEAQTRALQSIRDGEDTVKASLQDFLKQSEAAAKERLAHAIALHINHLESATKQALVTLQEQHSDAQAELQDAQQEARDFVLKIEKEKSYFKSMLAKLSSMTDDAKGVLDQVMSTGQSVLDSFENARTDLIDSIIDRLHKPMKKLAKDIFNSLASPIPISNGRDRESSKDSRSSSSGQKQGVPRRVVIPQDSTQKRKATAPNRPSTSKKQKISQNFKPLQTKPTSVSKALSQTAIKSPSPFSVTKSCVTPTDPESSIVASQSFLSPLRQSQTRNEISVKDKRSRTKARRAFGKGSSCIPVLDDHDFDFSQDY